MINVKCPYYEITESLYFSISDEDHISHLAIIVTLLALFREIMCIHFGMSIEHDFIQNTIYCVPACICAQHCIMRARQLIRGDPTVSVSAQFMSCSPGDDQGTRGLLPTVCAYRFYVCRIQISQVCITSKLCGPMSQSCIPAFSLQFMCITLS